MFRNILLTSWLGLSGFSLALPAVPALAAERAQTQTVTLGVKNMTCNMCPITVRKALENVPGVKAEVSYEAASARIETDGSVDSVQQQQTRVTELRQAKYENILESQPGINLIRGWARFENAHTLIVTREALCPDLHQGCQTVVLLRGVMFRKGFTT